MKLLKQKKENYYFDTFLEVAKIASEASNVLNEFIQNFDSKKIVTYVENLHELENNADIKRHELCDRLVHEFITPIEREDISSLSQGLDDVVDAIDDIIRKIYMFNLEDMREEALEFANIISSVCSLFINIFSELSNFKKSNTIHDFIIELNTLENNADKLHADSIKHLFSDKTSSNLTLAWTIVFDTMEACIDTSEKVADMVNAIITKNT